MDSIVPIRAFRHISITRDIGGSVALYTLFVLHSIVDVDLILTTNAQLLPLGIMIQK